jgi:hypothetical protein
MIIAIADRENRVEATPIRDDYAAAAVKADVPY